MEFEAHNKGISSLVMLSEGTLLSGGEKDRKIAAWDSLQNYKRITDTKVIIYLFLLLSSFLKNMIVLRIFIYF